MMICIIAFLIVMLIGLVISQLFLYQHLRALRLNIDRMMSGDLSEEIKRFINE